MQAEGREIVPPVPSFPVSDRTPESERSMCLRVRAVLHALGYRWIKHTFRRCRYPDPYKLHVGCR